MTQRRWDAIVIGAGLGGLTAAALWAAQGRRVLVLERNAYFGGAACTYRHAGLSIDASLHEINGVTPGDPKMRILQDAGVLDRVTFSPVPEFAEVHGRIVGDPLLLPSGLDAFEAALAARFSASAGAVHDHMETMRRLHRALAEANADHGALWWLVHGPQWLADLFPAVWRGRSSVQDAFAAFYGDAEGPKAAQAALMEYFSPDAARLWFSFFTAVMASYIQDGGHYVRGGSGAFADAFVAAIRSHGGTLRERREAVRIHVSDAGAEGVSHHGPSGDLETDFAPVLFGNAAPSVLGAMLDPSLRARFEAPYRSMDLSTSLFTMAFGLTRKPSELGVRAYSTAVFPDWMERLEQAAMSPHLLGGNPEGRLPKYILTDPSHIDSGLTHSKGRFVLSVTGADRLENWAGLSPDDINERKARWVEAIVEDLDRRFPGMASAIDWREMANARTMARYLNTPGGAVYGFAATPPDPFPHPPRVETAIAGLYLASAFSVSGGYTGAITGGSMAARAAFDHPRGGVTLF